MSFYEKFAKKYVEEAKKDLERARKALNEEDYPDSVFHSQQCVEKSAKAMVEAKRKYIYNHGPALGTIFVEALGDEWREELDEVLDAIGWFTEYYTRSRYPFLLRGEVVSPNEFLDKETANVAYEKAGRVLEIAQKYLRGRGIIQ